MRCKTLAKVAQHEWKRTVWRILKDVSMWLQTPLERRKILPDMFRLIE